MLSEQELYHLGFERNDVSAEESGDKPYYYFTLPLIDNECLISCENNDTKEYDVKLFNTHGLGKCYTPEEVKILYKALMKKNLIEI